MFLLKKIILIFGFLLFSTFGNFSAFAESSYVLEIDENSYDLKYELQGDVIAMAIDQELTSLLIGIENTRDSNFSINLPDEMISAENNAFAVLVDGFEVDYSIETMDNSVKMSFFIPQGTQEIEIIGTHVIPEFPFSVILGFVLATTIVFGASKIAQNRFR